MALNNFFMIVGGQKCGTSSMHNWLDQNPSICMSYPKEPKFFEIQYQNGPGWYERQHFFDEAEAYGESRVQNILIKYVPQRIYEYNPNTKIVIMLRNPIDRFISAWNHFAVMRPGREIRTLEQAIDEGIANFDLNCFDSEEKFYANLDPKGGPYGGRYLEHGMYADHIQRFNDLFDTSVILLDDIIANPQKEYSELLEFLGIRDFKPEFLKLNVKNPEMLNQVQSRERLKTWYRNSVERLSEGLKRDLTTEWGFK